MDQERYSKVVAMAFQVQDDILSDKGLTIAEKARIIVQRQAWHLVLACLDADMDVMTVEGKLATLEVIIPVFKKAEEF